MNNSDQYYDRAIEALKESKLIEGMTKQELDDLTGIGRMCEFSRRTSIIRENDRSRDLFVISQGRVSIRLSLPMEQSRDEVVYTMREGQIFGELALVDGSPRSATVVTEDDVLAVQFEYDDLSKLLDEQPRIGFVLMRNIASIIAARVRNTNMLWRNSLIW